MVEIRLATLEDLDKLQEHFENEDGYPAGWGRKRLEAYVEELGFTALAVDNEKTDTQQNIAGHLIFEVLENPNLGVGMFKEFHVSLPNLGIEDKMLEFGVHEAQSYFIGINAEPSKAVALIPSDSNLVSTFLGQGFEIPPSGGDIGRLYPNNRSWELILIRDLKDYPDKDKLEAFYYSLNSGIIDWSLIYDGKDPKQGIKGMTGKRALEMLVDRKFLIYDTGNRAELTRLEVRDISGRTVILNPRDGNEIFYFATKNGAKYYVRYLRTLSYYKRRSLRIKSVGAD